MFYIIEPTKNFKVKTAEIFEETLTLITVKDSSGKFRKFEYPDELGIYHEFLLSGGKAAIMMPEYVWYRNGENMNAVRERRDTITMINELGSLDALIHKLKADQERCDWSFSEEEITNAVDIHHRAAHASIKAKELARKGHERAFSVIFRLIGMLPEMQYCLYSQLKEHAMLAELLEKRTKYDLSRAYSSMKSAHENYMRQMGLVDNGEPYFDTDMMHKYINWYMHYCEKLLSLASCMASDAFDSNNTVESNIESLRNLRKHVDKYCTFAMTLHEGEYFAFLDNSKEGIQEGRVVAFRIVNEAPVMDYELLDFEGNSVGMYTCENLWRPVKKLASKFSKDYTPTDEYSE